MYWLIDWFFDLHTQSDNRSVSLSMVVENKGKRIEWVILLYQIRSSSFLRRVEEWKSLNRLSIIHSITQISIAIHIIGPLYQLLCFVSINDPFYVQHIPYHSPHSLQSDICRIVHLLSAMNDWNRVRLRYHSQAHSHPFPFFLIQFSML